MKKITFFLMAMLLIIGAVFAQEPRETENAIVPAKRFPGAMSVIQETTNVEVPQNTPPTNRAVLLNEGFESTTFPPTGWTIVDSDGDGNNWQRGSSTTNPSTATHSGTGCAVSESWRNDVVFFPDNWLITPQVAIPATGATLKFWIGAQDQSYYWEKYSVLISTTNTQLSSFTAIHTEVVVAYPDRYYEVVLPLAAYAGQNIYVAFRHHDVSDVFQLLLDDVSITSIPEDPTINIASTVAFGNVLNNVSTTYSRTVNIVNEGLQALTLSLASSSPAVTVTGLPPSIPALGSATITVTLDHTSLPTGAYNGNFVLTTNDPEKPTVTVAVTATVQTADIRSFINEDFNAALPTGWVFAFTGAASFSRQTTGGVNNTPCMRANVWSASTPVGAFETPYVTMGSNPVHSFAYKVTNYTGGAPTPGNEMDYVVLITKNFGTDWELLADEAHTMSADFATINFNLSAYANEICKVQVQFWRNSGDFYVWVDDVVLGTPPVDPIIEVVSPFAFGNAFNNLPFPTTRPISVKNAGPQPLIISSVVSSSPEITITGVPLTIAPGATETINVVLNLNGAPPGAYSGNFILASNDPATPQKTVVVNATAVAAVISDFIEEDFTTATPATPAGWTLTRFSRLATEGINNSPCLRANLYGTTFFEGIIEPTYVHMGANPVFSFYYNATGYSSPYPPATATQLIGFAEISNDNGVTWTKVWELNEGDHVPTPVLTFNFVNINVSAYANQLCLTRIVLRSNPPSSAVDLYVRVDDVTIGTPPQRDLVLDAFTGPLLPIATISNDYVVTVLNKGRLTANNYTVSILGENNEVFATQTVTTPLVWKATRVFTFPLTFAQSQAGPMNIKAVVTYADDENLSNNEMELAIDILPHPGYELDCSNSAFVTSGTVSNTNYTLPTNNLWNRSYTQQIYDAAELGIEPGTIINAIAFLPTHASSNVYTKFNQEIYLANTTRSTFANATDRIPADELQLVVYPRTISFPHNVNPEWFPIEFDQPFVYTGDNIAVIYVNNSGAYASANCFRTGSTATVKANSTYTDNVVTLSPTNIPTGLSSLTYTYRNHIQFIACEKYYTLNKDDIYGEHAVVTLNPTDPVLEGTDAWVSIRIDAVGLENCYFISKITFDDEEILGPLTEYRRDYPEISDALPRIIVETEQYKYTMTSYVDPTTPYGSISPETMEVCGGTRITYTITPDLGYTVDAIYYNGENLNLSSATRVWTTPYIWENNTFVVKFKEAPYRIDIVYAGTGDGIVELVENVGTSDELRTEILREQPFLYVDELPLHLVFTPAYGSHLEAVYIDGELNPTAAAIQSYRFQIVTSDHEVKVVFTLDNMIIVATAGPNGAISPAGNVPVPYSTTQRFLFTPNTGYTVDQIFKDNIAVNDYIEGSNYYDYKDVVTNGTIHVTYTKATLFIKLVDRYCNDMLREDIVGGTISPYHQDGWPVLYNGIQRFDFTPDEGYRIAQVWVDCVPYSPAIQTGSYTFYYITEDHTIAVEYELIPYPITASINGNGKISDVGTTYVNHGNDKEYTFSANTGYKITNLFIDGINTAFTLNENGVGSYTFINVTAPRTISVITALQTFNINATAGTGGIITPAGDFTVNYGQSKTFTFTPSPGYNLKSVEIREYTDDVPGPWIENVEALLNGAHTFMDIVASYDIKVSFEIKRYQIYAIAGGNGSIYPAGILDVTYGEEMTFYFTPENGYEILDVLVNNVSVGARDTYTFTEIDADGDINVSFTPIIPVIIDSPTMDGVSVYSQMNTVYITNINLLPIQDVSIMDMYGRVVWQGKVFGTHNQITMEVANGIYAVRVATNNQFNTTKVSIQR